MGTKSSMIATTFSGLCAQLGCPLTNVRNRWSAVSASERRALFTVWTDRIKNGRYVYGEAANSDNRAGSRELREHINFVLSTGAESYGIVCEARDTKAVPRSRRKFDAELLLVLRFVVERGRYVAYITGEVPVAAVIAGNVRTQVRRVSDALDDLQPDDGIGASAPDRVTGVTSGFRRDRRVRDRVLKRARGECEYCGAKGFEMADGRSYIEAHHIINLARKGADNMGNVIGLCATHHREAHYGKAASALESELKAILLKLQRPRSAQR